MDNLHKLLRVAFALIWIGGLIGLIGSPLIRHIATDIDTGDPYADLLLSLHPSNAYHHPHFYTLLHSRVKTLVQMLPTDTREIHVVAGVATTPERVREYEILRRNLDVWIYPLVIESWCEASNCPVDDGTSIITWQMDIPERDCSPPEQGLSLCR